MATRQQQISAIKKKAEQVQSTFNKVKGSMTQADIKKASEGISKASSGIRTISSNLSRSSGSKVITPESLDKVEAVNLPEKTVPTTPGLDLSLINSSLGADATGMFNIPKQTGDTEGVTAAKDSANVLGQYLEKTIGFAKPTEGANEQALADARRQAGVDAAQREFNRYSNQINTITAQRDAAQLSLEGQGRGQTMSFIGGEQARIGREAAIQALPIQAQLAAAQGNLEQAQQLMGQLFTAKTADIQADLAYRQNLVNSVMSWATTSQQAILQAKQADIAQRASIAQANLAYQRQLGLQALEYGQNNLITGIASIDPSSPTFEQDIAQYVSRLRKPVEATAPRAPTTQTVDGKLYQYDYGTGTWKLAVGAGGAPGAGSPESESLLSLKQVLDTIGAQAPGFSSAVGFGIKKNAFSRTLAGMGVGGAAGFAAGSVVPGIGNLIGGAIGTAVGGATGFFSGPDATAGSARSDFEAQAQRLADMFLVENLDKMSGVLTDKDIEVLRNEGTTIGNLDQSESAWLREKARLDAMVERGLRQNGITPEQAAFFGYIDPEEQAEIDKLWNTNSSTPLINFSY
jgi:hypothetical protein